MASDQSSERLRNSGGSDSTSGPIRNASLDHNKVECIGVPATEVGSCQLEPAAERDLNEGHVLATAEKYDAAVTRYTAALRKSTDTRANLRILLYRSEAYARLSKSILDRPARASEDDAIFGLDPCHYAMLSLQDAEVAEQIDSELPYVHYRKGIAFMLLEQYEKARDSFVRALFFEPADRQSQEAMKQADAALQNERKPMRARSLTNLDDFECILCLKLLFEPVTTPCGHTFCSACFLRTTDHGNRCPMCRTVMHVGKTLPVTVTLKNIIEKNFPEEYEQRRAEEAVQSSATTGEAALPLFVMSLILPGEKMALNIFEPRYRLMVRRCMEGNRKFGMAFRLNTSQDVYHVACECEITECKPLPDGRFYLEVVARRRCKLLETWEHDGYRVGVPQYLTDDPEASPQPPANEDTEQLQDLIKAVDELADRWIDSLRTISRSRSDYQVYELLARVGDRPATSDIEGFSFWVARLLPRVEPSVKLELLTTQSTRKRLQVVRDILINTCNSYTAGGCCLM